MHEKLIFVTNMRIINKKKADCCLHKWLVRNFNSNRIITHINSVVVICIFYKLINTALLGKSAKQWKDENLNLSENMCDYLSINELICLSNMENINAVFYMDK